MTPGAQATAVYQFLTSTNSRSSSVLSWNYGVETRLTAWNFLADPTGVNDSTTAINNAPSLRPRDRTRRPRTAGYLSPRSTCPPASYKVTSDLLIQSTQGFNFEGDGAELTILVASGSGFTTAVLNVDGSYAGRYSGFTIKGDGTEQVTNGINLTWTTNAQRSTTGNKFQDIRMRNLNFVTGFSMAGITNRQVDSTRLDRVVIGGQQTPGSWSNSGNWQKGFEFGNGTFANIYDQVLTRCDPSGCYYGYYNNVSSFSLNGAQPANNNIDFYMSPGAQEQRSPTCSRENCGTFLIAPSNFAPEPTSFNDIQVKTNFLNGAGGNTVISLGGGTWNFSNFSAPGCAVTTSVAAGSNGGEISQIASWSSPSAGVLSVASVTGLAASGQVNVATTSGTAIVTYASVSAGQLNGCAYVSGSPTGTVATGGVITGYANANITLTGASASRPCIVNFCNLVLFGLRTSAFHVVQRRPDRAAVLELRSADGPLHRCRGRSLVHQHRRGVVQHHGRRPAAGQLHLRHR